MNTENPFANEHGAVIPGREPEFFQWERDRELERLNKLPERERAEILESEKELSKRMNS
jgi:hypothetical protein